MGSGTVSSINPNCLPSSALPAFNRQPASLSLPFQPFQPPTPQIPTRLYSSSSTNSYLSIISWPNLQRQFFCNSQPITDQLLSFILFSLLYHLFSFILFPSPLLSFILSLYSFFLYSLSSLLSLWFLSLSYIFILFFFLLSDFWPLSLHIYFLSFFSSFTSFFSLPPIILFPSLLPDCSPIFFLFVSNNLTCHFPCSISSTLL